MRRQGDCRRHALSPRAGRLCAWCGPKRLCLIDPGEEVPKGAAGSGAGEEGGTAGSQQLAAVGAGDEAGGGIGDLAGGAEDDICVCAAEVQAALDGLLAALAIQRHVLQGLTPREGGTEPDGLVAEPAEAGVELGEGLVVELGHPGAVLLRGLGVAEGRPSRERGEGAEGFLRVLRLVDPGEEASKGASDV